MQQDSHGGSNQERALRDVVATACRALFRIGLVDYMGHASARVPGTDRVVIKPRHSERITGMNRLTSAQMVVIDLDGNLLEGNEPPPSERFIHTGIYRARPDVGGVVHTHQTLATLFGVVGREILPLLHAEAPLVKRGVPTYPSPELIESAELGDAVAGSLADYPACHLQGHGVVTVGRDVQEGTVRAIHLERLARANLIAAQLGTPRVITPEEIARIEGPMVGYGVRWAYYSSLADDDSGPPPGW